MVRDEKPLVVHLDALGGPPRVREDPLGNPPPVSLLTTFGRLPWETSTQDNSTPEASDRPETRLELLTRTSSIGGRRSQEQCGRGSPVGDPRRGNCSNRTPNYPFMTSRSPFLRLSWEVSCCSLPCLVVFPDFLMVLIPLLSISGPSV